MRGTSYAIVSSFLQSLQWLIVFTRISCSHLYASLLENRAYHQRVRVLSRKARESEIYCQGPPCRREPRPCPNLTEQLSNRQRSQRERRRKEKDVRLNDVLDVSANLSNVFSQSSVAENTVQETRTRVRRKKAQNTRRVRERTMAGSIRSNQDGDIHLVST